MLLLVGGALDDLHEARSDSADANVLNISNSLLCMCRWKWLNSATYSFIFWALWQQESARINTWRTSSLGLPPLTRGPAAVLAAAHTLGADIPVVMMCSSHVVPGLKAPGDWPANCHLTGFAFPPVVTAEADVEPRLRKFVLQGDSTGSDEQQQQGNEASAPLYLGFGSMPAPDPKALLEMAMQVGCCIMHMRASTLSRSPVDDAPNDCIDCTILVICSRQPTCNPCSHDFTAAGGQDDSAACCAGGWLV
jgi:hypothetical protein